MRRPPFTLGLLGLLGVALAGPAAALDANEQLKNTAIVGTLATQAYAAWRGAPLTRCDDTAWRARTQVGHDDEMSLLQLGAARGRCDLTEAGDWSLSYAPTVALGLWSASRVRPGYASEAVDLSATPMLHWRRPLRDGLSLDVELGIGVAWLSASEVGLRSKSTQFQFSDQVGLALSGPQERWRAGLAFRHVSNANIGTPNNGLDFRGLFVEWRL